MPLIGFAIFAVCLLMPYWIYEQVKANHKLMIKGFAECMNALDYLEVRLARMERAAGYPPIEDPGGSAESTEPVSTDAGPS